MYFWCISRVSWCDPRVFLLFPGVFLVFPGVFLARTKGSRGTELCVMVYVILVGGRDSARIALMVCLRQNVLTCQRKVACSELTTRDRSHAMN